jgi:hypothetical protein
MPNPDDTEYLPPFASEWMAQWRIAAARLESLRRREIRDLTEASAARVFALLDPPRPYQLRPSSGLIEQQRWFAELRRKMACSAPECKTGQPTGSNAVSK